jgi:hypothetical protein
LSPCLLSINLEIKIQKAIILCVVLYGLETWSLALREEHTLRLFENRVLRRRFKLGGEGGGIGGRRRLHIRELHCMLVG